MKKGRRKRKEREIKRGEKENVGKINFVYIKDKGIKERNSCMYY